MSTSRHLSRLIDEQAAADRPGLSVKSLRRWHRAGRRPVLCKLRAVVRHAESDLPAFIEDGRRQSTSDVGGDA